MSKRSFEPGIMLAPVPAVLVSCASKAGERNIITLAWAGVVNSDPPMVSVSIRPSRFSYNLIAETKEFVINVPTLDMEEVVDGCGVTSGKKVDKFEAFRLTPQMGTLDYAPYIKECPSCLECKVRQVMTLGSHDLFLARIVNVMLDEKLLDSEDRYDPRHVNFLGFSAGYYLDARATGHRAGFSRQKKE